MRTSPEYDFRAVIDRKQRDAIWRAVGSPSPNDAISFARSSKGNSRKSTPSCKGKPTPRSWKQRTSHLTLEAHSQSDMERTELPTQPPPATRPVSTPASLIAGSAGGMCQVIAGNPLDVLKTRAQLAAPGQYKGTLDIAMQTFRNEGILAFYKGVLESGSLVAAWDALMLGVRQVSRRPWSALPPSTRSSLPPTRPLVGSSRRTRTDFRSPRWPALELWPVPFRRCSRARLRCSRRVLDASNRPARSLDSEAEHSQRWKCRFDCKHSTDRTRRGSGISSARCIPSTDGRMASCADTG